jgi:hypothetical protein
MIPDIQVGDLCENMRIALWGKQGLCKVQGVKQMSSHYRHAGDGWNSYLQVQMEDMIQFS